MCTSVVNSLASYKLRMGRVRDLVGALWLFGTQDGKDLITSPPATIVHWYIYIYIQTKLDQKLNEHILLGRLFSPTFAIALP